MFKKKSNNMYIAKVGCNNCDAIQNVTVEKGKVVSDWINQKKVLCYNCMCKETLMHIDEYHASKAMLKDFLAEKMSGMDGEGKKQGHFQ